MRKRRRNEQRLLKPQAANRVARIEEFSAEIHRGTHQGSGRMKSALRQTVAGLALLGLLLGLALTLAHSERRRNAAHDSGSAQLAAHSLQDSLAASPIGLRLGFTMADFTGDTHPDLAMVELNRFDAPRGQYSIEVQLTEGGHQSLPVTAPLGGVLVTAKDVTGDGNLDLIVRSARSRVPVAVFLNDGRGHFSAAKPDAYAQVLREIDSEHEFGAEHCYFVATPLSSESYPIHSQGGSVRVPDQDRVRLRFADQGAPLEFFLFSGSNRAPPAAV
jgi:hypothetical protein